MTKTQVEGITSVERRRRWSRAEKERLVAAAIEAGAVASEIARAAGIATSLQDAGEVLKMPRRMLMPSIARGVMGQSGEHSFDLWVIVEDRGILATVAPSTTRQIGVDCGVTMMPAKQPGKKGYSSGQSCDAFLSAACACPTGEEHLQLRGQMSLKIKSNVVRFSYLA